MGRAVACATHAPGHLSLPVSYGDPSVSGPALRAAQALPPALHVPHGANHVAAIRRVVPTPLAPHGRVTPGSAAWSADEPAGWTRRIVPVVPIRCRTWPYILH